VCCCFSHARPELQGSVDDVRDTNLPAAVMPEFESKRVDATREAAAAVDSPVSSLFQSTVASVTRSVHTADASEVTLTKASKTSQKTKSRNSKRAP
jgi:hypothetical protein